ncbi:hypothetical protein LCGC14_0801850 [marine sediment metagenome]|uniref:Uncharacterized protein n=1 Tax=marine sediment metagenome TaxID=412755 RepID=A0A0F9S9E8_9ZZZZ
MPDKYYSKEAIAERLSRKIKRPRRPDVMQSLLERMRALPKLRRPR